MKPHTYCHTVHYYETDKMGLTHHSNYIRWMEETRVDFLSAIGWGYDRLEALGIASPVLGVTCDYQTGSTFADEILIEAGIREYRGARLTIWYRMTNRKTGAPVASGESRHCFTNAQGRPIILKKQLPEFHEALSRYISGE